MKAKWYLANLIEFAIIRSKKTLKILNEKNPEFWDNLVLIKAGGSDSAYKKANKIGNILSGPYTNTDGDYVEWKFAGVRELVEIYNPLEDCEELAYSEGSAPSFKAIRKLIPPKNKLGLFEFEHRKKQEKEGGKSKNKPQKKRVKKDFHLVIQKGKEDKKMVANILGNINKNI